MVGIVLAALFGTAPSVATPRADRIGPSYSCAARSLTATERSICANPTLAGLDLELAYAFSEAVQTSSRALLIDARQAAWLVDVRDACATDACLARVYRARIAELRALTASPTRHADLWDGSPGLILPSSLEKRLLAESGDDCLSQFARVDLGDGLPSYAATSCHHGANNVFAYVFHPTGGTYRLVLSALTDGVDLQDERSYGLRRIRVRGHGSAAEQGATYFDYDGSAYRPTFCAEVFIRAPESYQRTEFGDCWPGNGR